MVCVYRADASKQRRALLEYDSMRQALSCRTYWICFNTEADVKHLLHMWQEKSHKPFSVTLTDVHMIDLYHSLEVQHTC